MDNKKNRKTCELMSIIKNDANNTQDIEWFYVTIKNKTIHVNTMLFHGLSCISTHYLFTSAIKTYLP